MKRYDFDIHADYSESTDGGWIRYADHVEAMKRIAGDSAQQPIYQVWDVDMLAWKDVQQDSYNERLPSNRRIVYAAPAQSEAPICTCPSGDGSLRHPCPSHPSASPEPYNAYQRDWEKVVRWVKVQSETFPELASMSPEGAISWLVVELAARHEKFAEPSASPAALTDAQIQEVLQKLAPAWWDVPQGATEAFARALLAASPAAPAPASPAALTDEQALDISIDLGMVRKDYGGYFVNKLTVEEIMEAIRSLCTESPAAPIAAETEPMAWLFVKSGKKMKIFVRAEASELLDGHYPLFGQSASQLKRHVPQANEQFIAPKLELLAASPAAPAPSASPADQVARGPSSHVLSVNEIAKAAWDEAWQMAYGDGLSAGHPLGCSTLDRDTEWADSEVVAILAANSRSI